MGVWYEADLIEHRRYHWADCHRMWRFVDSHAAAVLHGATLAHRDAPASAHGDVRPHGYRQRGADRHCRSCHPHTPPSHACAHGHGYVRAHRYGHPCAYSHAYGEANACPTV